MSYNVTKGEVLGELNELQSYKGKAEISKHAAARWIERSALDVINGGAAAKLIGIVRRSGRST